MKEKRKKPITAKDPPSSSPELVVLGARKSKLEAEREDFFKKWKVALAAAEGCVSRAAKLMDPPISRSRADTMTRRLKLMDWAAGLRLAATGNALGRQDRKK